MQVGKNGQLAVKWQNGTWTYYRVEKYRKFEALASYFTGLDNFRFAILYEYNPKTKSRGPQIGYISKKENWFRA